MAFQVNIFGTTHAQPDKDNLFYFNLHVLSVKTQITPPSVFNMFLKFYAFPFNTTPKGTQIVCQYFNNNPADLNNRFLVRKPQVVHINSMTPPTPIELFNCGTPSSNYCTTAQELATISGLNPCPVNAEDVRIYSNTFCVPIKNKLIVGDWTNMTTLSGQKSLNQYEGEPFILPIDITIIADGCYYLSNPETSKVKIYNPFMTTYNSTSIANPYGSINCVANPNFYPIGKDDIINVS